MGAVYCSENTSKSRPSKHLLSNAAGSSCLFLLLMDLVLDVFTAQNIFLIQPEKNVLLGILSAIVFCLPIDLWRNRYQKQFET